MYVFLMQDEPGAPHEYDDCEVLSNEYEVPVDGKPFTAANGSIRDATVQRLDPAETLYETPVDATSKSNSTGTSNGGMVVTTREYIAPAKTDRKKTAGSLLQTTDYEIPCDAS